MFFFHNYCLISLYDSLGFVWQQEGAGGGERAGDREGGYCVEYVRGYNEVGGLH